MVSLGGQHAAKARGGGPQWRLYSAAFKSAEKKHNRINKGLHGVGVTSLGSYGESVNH